MSPAQPVCVFSDLHQDWPENAWDPSDHAPPDGFDVAVVAGDVHMPLTRALDWLDERLPGMPVVYVPGNHDFWWDRGDERYTIRDQVAGDTPSRIQQLGDDSWGTPLDEVPQIKLVEPIAPVGSAKALEERDVARAAAQRLHRRCQDNERYIAHLRQEIDRLEGLIDGLTKIRTSRN